ncbi:MAG: conjugal transfer protein TraD [Bacillota bacterium]
MAGKSLEERIADTEERIRQRQARKQGLAQQARQQERKDRTRRLIQIGGIMARLGIDTLEKAQALQREVERRQEVREWLSKVAQRTKPQPSTEPADEA